MAWGGRGRVSGQRSAAGCGVRCECRAAVDRRWGPVRGVSAFRRWSQGGAGARGGSPGGKGCEPTLSTVLMFWMSEGASTEKERESEDTPNARVAE